MKNETVIEIVKAILESDRGYEIVLRYDKGDEELKVKEGYSITLKQTTFYQEDIKMAEALSRRFKLDFSIEGESLDFYET